MTADQAKESRDYARHLLALALYKETGYDMMSCKKALAESECRYLDALKILQSPCPLPRIYD